MKDYYYILGLSNEASQSDIKEAYRKLAQKLHPDKNSGDKFFEEYFRNLKDAYETLSDPNKKETYDNTLKLYHLLRSYKRHARKNQQEEEERKQKDEEYQARMRQYEAKKKKEESPLGLKEKLLVHLLNIILPMVAFLTIPGYYLFKDYQKKSFQSLVIGMAYMLLILIFIIVKTLLQLKN